MTMEPLGPPDADRVRTPDDLIGFLRALREDLIRDEEAVGERVARGEKYAQGLYASYRLADALESLAGWLEHRFSDESYQPLPEASDPAKAEVWREIAACFEVAVINE
jgi:hypothetical protein